MNETRKTLFSPIPPFDPVKRAQSIRDAIAKKRIKRTKELDEIIVILDEIVAQEKQSA